MGSEMCIRDRMQLEAAMAGLTRMVEIGMERETLHRQRLRRARKQRKP